MLKRGLKILALAGALVLTGCGGGGGNNNNGGGNAPPIGGGGGGGANPPPVGGVFGFPALESLSSAEVGIIIGRAAAQANASGAPATIAVVDRVGNVLAVFEMDGAPDIAVISDAPNGQNIDIQGLDVPSGAAAIAKAITGAYLSSSGNAFTSRTASQIAQEHFPPAPSTAGLESGPLFGVQFTQLPCSDLASRFMPMGAGALIGPKRSPLGLSADPGGFPLYKNGVVVGGIGAISDGVYGFDDNTLDIDADLRDERTALAGTVGFESSVEIRANRISVDGTQLRFSDITYADLNDVSAATFADADAIGDLVPVRGYYPTPVLRAGTAYGAENSGIRPTTTAEFTNPDAYVLTDGAGNNRFPIRGGTDGADIANPITQAEALAILEEAFTIMSRARAQIRKPLDSPAQVTISLVDTRGQVLGIVRSPDAPIFGTDTSLQKARTANFFSAPFAAAELLATPGEPSQFVGRVRTFLNDPNALTGSHAFADRSGGNLARPYFPDGEVGTPNGPLSRPIEQFNPFSTGLQSALILPNLGQHLAFITGASNVDTPRICTQTPQFQPNSNRLSNGIQIFPGSVPVYRGGVLIGGLGVSGDGIDQDDMISFLGTHNAGQRLGGFGNAPIDIRADQIEVDVNGRPVRLRYISCPFAPFLDTAAQNPCEGI